MCINDPRVDIGGVLNVRILYKYLIIDHRKSKLNIKCVYACKAGLAHSSLDKSLKHAKTLFWNRGSKY